MSLAFKIAARFLKSSKSQTTLICLGIAVGVAVQIFIGSLIQGLQESLINKTIGNSPQITLSSNSNDKLIDNYRNILSKVRLSDDRIINLSVTADGSALVKQDNATYSVLVRGMNINDSDKIYNIKNRIYDGNPPKSDFETLVGKNLKEQLHIKLGDEINAITNSGQSRKLKVTGFYDSKVSSINKSWLITTLDTSQKLFGYDNKITGIEMQTNKIFSADEIALNIAKNIPKSITVDNWKGQNSELLSGLNGQSISSIMIQIFVLIAVILGITSVLAITVIQRSRQIGILKAMGINDASASFIFLFEGLILGIIGTILGIILGIGLLLMFTRLAVNPDGTPVVPVYIDYKFIAVSSLIALTSSVIASIIPARRSSKLNPIEVIRNA